MQPDNRPEDTAPEELDWPETLHITIATHEEAAERALEAAGAAEQGERTPTEISFANANKLRKLLTDRRFEIIRSLMDEPADSISALAKRLDRSYSVVHEDVEILAEYGIIKFRGDTSDRAPFIPYESIALDVTIEGTQPKDAEATA